MTEDVKQDMYQLIDTELSESRLFRFTASFSRLNGRDVADLLYLETLNHRTGCCTVVLFQLYTH